MNNFKDHAFKAHITLSLYGKKIIDKEFNKLIKSIDFEQEGYDLCPTIFDFLVQFELSKNVLSSFTETTDWMVNERIFKKIVPYFDGEEHPFVYRSFNDVLLLTNLTSFESTSQDEAIDLTPIIEHQKLKRVVLYGTEYDGTKIKNAKEKEFKKLLTAGFEKNQEINGKIEFVKK